MEEQIRWRRRMQIKSEYKRIRTWRSKMISKSQIIISCSHEYNNISTLMYYASCIKSIQNLVFPKPPTSPRRWSAGYIVSKAASSRLILDMCCKRMSSIYFVCVYHHAEYGIYIYMSWCQISIVDSSLVYNVLPHRDVHSLKYIIVFSCRTPSIYIC
jgi:hypothetical protein